MLTATTTKIRAAEWDGAAATLAAVVAAGPVVAAAGPVVAAAGRAEAVVEAVAEANVLPRARAPMARKFLERISKETGGRFFEVSKKESVGDIYTSIVEELRTQYSMGYTPDKDSAASGYHHVVLAVKKKDLSVQTRDGYYADR